MHAPANMQTVYYRLPHSEGYTQSAPHHQINTSSDTHSVVVLSIRWGCGLLAAVILSVGLYMGLSTETIGETAVKTIFKAAPVILGSHNQHVVERDNFMLLQQNQGLQHTIATQEVDLRQSKQQISFLENKINELENEPPVVVYKQSTATQAFVVFEDTITSNKLRNYLLRQPRS